MKVELIFVVFAILAAADKILGNRFKLGEEFDKGIMTAGALIISMSGMIVLSPLLAKGLFMVFEPILGFLHVDLSILGSLFPVDAGGASLAYELSENRSVRAYNGIVVSSMFGATICPVIPLSLQMVKKEYHGEVLIGLLCGIATIPFGCMAAGLMMGCSLAELAANTFLIVILSMLLCVGLWKCPGLSQKVLSALGKILMGFVTVGLCLGIIQKLTGKNLIEGLAPMDDAFLIIGNIAILLSGVFPMIAVISRIFHKLFLTLGKCLQINHISVVGLLTTLANSVPVFSMVEKMDQKGRIMNMAFGVSAGYVFGDHLAFVLSFDRAFAFPMVVGKLLSGILALVLSEIIYRRIAKK